MQLWFAEAHVDLDLLTLASYLYDYDRCICLIIQETN